MKCASLLSPYWLVRCIRKDPLRYLNGCPGITRAGVPIFSRWACRPRPTPPLRHILDSLSVVFGSNPLISLMRRIFHRRVGFLMRRSRVGPLPGRSEANPGLPYQFWQVTRGHFLFVPEFRLRFAPSGCRRVRCATLSRFNCFPKVVREAGFDPAVSCFQGRWITKLSHSLFGGAHGRTRTRIFNSDYGSPVRSRRRLCARWQGRRATIPRHDLERIVSCPVRRRPQDCSATRTRTWIDPLTAERPAVRRSGIIDGLPGGRNRSASLQDLAPTPSSPACGEGEQTMVPCRGFEPRSPALQTGAFTR